MSRAERAELPIADLRLPIGDRARASSSSSSPPPAQSQIGNRKSKIVTYVVSRGWLHLCLITLAGIFIFPFLWMIATSLRTDEELIEPGWLPRIPSFVPNSPYVKPAADLVKPLDVPTEAWNRLSPKLLDAARSSLRASLAAVPIKGVDDASLVESAAAEVVNEQATRLPRELWTGSEANVLAAFTKLLTPDLAARALDDRVARLELRALQLRTLDAHVFSLCDEKQMGTDWKIESGDASIERAANGTAFLRYHFASSSDSPVVLKYDFTFPRDTKPEDLHKLLFSIQADASWHRVAATLDAGGKHWVSTEPTYLAQFRPSSIMLQPPSFDDQTMRAKRWITLKDAGMSVVGAGGRFLGLRPGTDPPAPAPAPAPAIGTNAADATAVAAGTTENPQHAVLRILIQPSSTVRAIFGKVQFNYRRAFLEVPFFTYVLNSIALVVLITVGTLFSSTFVAYAFARLNWPGRSVAFVLLLSTMMLPSQVTMIPQFMVWRGLGWYNTLNPIWVPAWLGGAFFIFLMVQNMKTIPRELEEAARIDGMSALQTWWYVIVPQVKPTAAAIAIMTVMGAWNMFMEPLIYLRDQSRFPLSLGLFALKIDNYAYSGGNDWTLIMAGNVIMTLPVVLMFILFQKYFVQGMTMSGMKG